MAVRDTESFKVSPAKAGMISCLGSLLDDEGGVSMTEGEHFWCLDESEDGRHFE